MKNFSVLLMLSVSGVLSAQIYTYQSFEGNSLPPGWTSFDDSALTSTAAVNFGTLAGSACAGSKAATRNIYGFLPEWYLVYTAPANSSNGTAVQFSFKYLAQPYDDFSTVDGSLNFEYSIDNGTTWTSALPAPVSLSAQSPQGISCTQVSGNIPAAVFSNLPAGTAPKFRFYANATSGGDFYQGFDDVSISQTITCPPPTNLISQATSPTAATLSWAAPAVPPTGGYQIFYSTSPGAPSATATPNATVPTGTTTYSVSGLSPATTYYFFVRSACSTTDFSPFGGPAVLTTPCSTYNAPYVNNFDNSIGSCWTVGSGLSNGQPSGNYSYWNLNGYLGMGANDSVSMNLYSNNRIGWLISPVFNLQPSNGSYKVEFDYGVTEWNDTTPSAMGSDDSVELLLSADGGNNWSPIHTFNAASNIQNTSTHFSYTIPSGTPVNNLKFAFVGNDGTVDDSEDYDFFIDNFAVNLANNLATAEINGKKKTAEVFPNPFGEQLGLADAKNVKLVEIFDAAGRIVKSVVNPGSTISTGDLKSGLYFIKINHKDGSASSAKAIKK